MRKGRPRSTYVIVWLHAFFHVETLTICAVFVPFQPEKLVIDLTKTPKVIPALDKLGFGEVCCLPLSPTLDDGRGYMHCFSRRSRTICWYARMIL